MNTIYFNHFTLIDTIAVLWFFTAWIGFTLTADYSPYRKYNVTEAINHYRKAWMMQMLKREMKMVDTQIMGNLGSGIAFFATTSVLIIGGLCAALGSGNEAVQILKEIPYASTTSRLAYDAKVILLISVFVYAFVKFSWSFRLSNYCSILIGASPNLGIDEDCTKAAELPARISGLAGAHFNRGLRSYFFAMAAMGWFVNGYVFMLATAAVLVTQYRREFKSRSLKALSEGLKQTSNTGN
jgi:uncharacterized membrane protein